MENTNDKTNNKAFVNHNSDKPFIRTMEDDLKKIKNIPAGSDSAASVASDFVSASSRADASRKEINRPNPAAPAKTLTPVSISKPASIPASPVPKNLPVDMPISEKEKFAAGEKTEILKPVEKSNSNAASKISDSRILSRPDFFGKKPVLEKISASSAAQDYRQAEPNRDGQAGVSDREEKVSPDSADIISRQPQGRRRTFEEDERLSPEARLARQSSLGLGMNDKKTDSGAGSSVSPSARISSVSPAQRSGKSAGSFGQSPRPPLVPSSFEGKRKSIEEIIEEDNGSSSYFKKFIKMFLAFLVIVGIAAGAYYLYASKKPAVAPVAADVPSEAFVSGITEATIKTDLNVNSIESIRSYFSRNIIPGTYRLILQDKDGRHNLGLEDFAKSLDIILPDTLASALEKDYNLLAFNYPEKNYLRLGLVLRPKNSVDIVTIAGSWEPNMYRSVEPIFLGNFGNYDPGKPFGSNKHGDFDIRYLSLGYDNIALNYSIDNERRFLLIAASKDDIFNLIDRVIKGR